MAVLEMVFGIVLVCASAAVLMAFINKDNKRGRQAEGAQARSLSRIENLEERIRVLEKIVTDKRFDLKRQIDDL